MLVPIREKEKKAAFYCFFLFTFVVFFERIYVSDRDGLGCGLEWRKGIFAFS